MDRPMKMNWGCGPVIADGWVNVDNSWDDQVDRVYRSTSEFDDESFDGIVANHSLQCLTHDMLDPAVREFHRLLRPGGRLRVLVPDVVAAFRALEDERDTWAGFVAISEPWSLGRKFAHYVTWGGQNRSVFTWDSLPELLERNDFTLSAEWWRAHHDDYNDEPGHDWAWLSALDTRLNESLIVEAVK